MHVSIPKIAREVSVYGGLQSFKVALADASVHKVGQRHADEA